MRLLYLATYWRLTYLLGLVRTLAVCLGIVVVISCAFPLFLLAAIPLAWFYWRVMQYYLATSRELKRLDAVSRSPILSYVIASIHFCNHG